jgi:hypothetical protein
MGERKNSGMDDPLSDEETERRRDAALLRALSTPHKRQADMKVGKRKSESGAEASPKKADKPSKTDYGN